MSRTRKESAAETREALIEAGVAAFRAEGLDASLDGICARAGYTRGAFYVHFKDRDDFLVAVMDRVGGQFLEALFTAAGGSLPNTVELFMQALAAGAYPLMGSGGIQPHQLLQACARSPVVRARYVGLIETSLDQLRGMVKGGQKAELRADVTADEVAWLMMAAVIGAGVMAELDLSVKPRQLADAFLRLLSERHRPKRS
jgi:AcrR family transcriptional regulator